MEGQFETDTVAGETARRLLTLLHLLMRIPPEHEDDVMADDALLDAWFRRAAVARMIESVRC